MSKNKLGPLVIEKIKFVIHGIIDYSQLTMNDIYKSACGLDKVCLY